MKNDSREYGLGQDSNAAQATGEPETAMSPFIPSWFDDARLTPAQFRVACRIARRGRCTEALNRMAEGCKLDRETVQRAINALVHLGIVTQQKRFGRTSILQFIPSGKGGLGYKTTQRQRRATTQRQRRANHLAALTGYKGYPSRLSIKGEPPRLENWQVEKDISRLRVEIRQQQEQPDRNRDALRHKRARLRELEAEQAHRAPPRKTAKPDRSAPTMPQAPSKPGEFAGASAERWKLLAAQAMEAAK